MRLALAGVRHHAGVLSGVVFGVALTTSLVVAGLAMGDSLRAALADRVTQQLGGVRGVLDAGDRRFTDGLAARVAMQTGQPAAALLTLDAVARGDAGSARPAQLVGVGPELSELAAGWTPPEPGQVLLSAALARGLSVSEGDRLVLRVERPGALPREAAIMQDEGRIMGLVTTVGPVLGAAWPSALGWRARPDAPGNAFVDRAWLAERLGVSGRSNVLLSAAEVSGDQLDEAWTLGDAGLQLERIEGEVMLTTERILLSETESRAASQEGATAGLTWFIDEIRLGPRATPYAFVTGVGPGRAAIRQRLPSDLADDGIVLNSWLATDLAARPGDVVTLTFPILGAHRAVSTETVELTVTDIIELEGAAADASWMPAFEGLAGRESCREWDPGLPVELDKIRDQDEDYWATWGGAPKAWVSLELAQRLWSNRYGAVSAVRYPGDDVDAVAAEIDAQLDPADLGLSVRSVREQLTAASEPANDFGLLFLGFEFVLVTAALMLAGLLFGFSLASRASEIGTLRAVGWPRARVRRLLWTEGALVATVGVLLGVPLSALVVSGLLQGLQGAWQGAVGEVALAGAVRPATVLTGALLAWFVSFGSLAWTARSLLGTEPRDLLLGLSDLDSGGPPAGWVLPLAAVSALIAAAVGFATPTARTPEAALAFFGAGFAVVVAGLGLLRWWLGRPVSSVSRSLGSLAWRGLARRPRRTVSVTALLALGAFLVVGVGLGGGQGQADATAVGSGTGGYALYLQTSLPLQHRLDSEGGRRAWALSEADLPDGSVLGLRELSGDDASCLHLGSAQTPRLLGVDSAVLGRRGAFGFTDAATSAEGWARLTQDLGPGRVAAVGDVGTVTWGLHRSVGDVLQYQGRDGRTVEVVIVGVLANTVFQGSLIVDEAAMLEHFRDPGGARVLLVDSEDADALAPVLSAALQDAGAVVLPAAERLQVFAAVEHTYVSIFHALGGLGLILGGLGVGVVLARGVLERRGELALLAAVGWPRARIARLLVLEHLGMVVFGLGLGGISAAVAVLPALRAPDAHPPLALAAVALVGTAVTALLGVQWGAWLGSRGEVSAALRAVGRR